MKAKVPPLPFSARCWLAWTCFFRVLFDGVFAARVRELSAPGSLAAMGENASEPVADRPVTTTAAVPAAAAANDKALQLLALLQREGRLVDFLRQDITAFPDAEVGAAARVVHEGCAKALGAHLEIRPVRSEREGAPVTLEVAEPSAVKLVGNVTGTAPFRGTLRHRGWRVESLRLPELVEGHDPRVLAPAEVEL